jgi:hypothetical protein
LDDPPQHKVPNPMRRQLFPALFLMLPGLASCGYRTDPENEKRLNMPVIPAGFDVKTVEKMKCPINGSKLRFATRKEFDQINDRIGNFKVRKASDGEPYTQIIEAILVREDGKIGYRVEKNEALLKAEDALILDEKFK